MKLDKKSIFYFGIVIVAGLICLVFVWHFSKIPEIEEVPLIEKEVKKEKTLEEIIKELTTPQEKGESLPEEIIQELTLPKKGKPLPLSEELIKELTAPQ